MSPRHRRDLRRFLADRHRGQRVLRPQERKRLDGRRRQCRRGRPRYWIPDRAVHRRRTMRSDRQHRRRQSFRKRGPSPRPRTGGAAEGSASACSIDGTGAMTRIRASGPGARQPSFWARARRLGKLQAFRARAGARTPRDSAMPKVTMATPNTRWSQLSASLRGTKLAPLSRSITKP
jgi:hypothetical protein